MGLLRRGFKGMRWIGMFQWDLMRKREIVVEERCRVGWWRCITREKEGVYGLMGSKQLREVDSN